MESDFNGNLIYPKYGYVYHGRSIANLLAFLSGLFAVGSLVFNGLFIFLDAFVFLFTFGQVVLFTDVSFVQRIVTSCLIIVMLIVTFIFGSAAKRHFHYSIVSAVFSSFCASCAFMGMSSPRISPGELFTVALLIISGLLSFSAMILYAVSWLKCNGFMASRLSDVRNEKTVTPSKKLTVGIIVGVILLTAIPTAIGVPLLFYKNCDAYYDEITYYMALTNLNTNVSAMEDIDGLPDNYKDVKELKRQTALLKEYAKEYEESATGAKAREAYHNMISLSKEDPRWNFDNCCDNRLLYGATWQTDDGEYYLQIGEDSGNELQLFYTNLPNSIPQDLQGNVTAIKNAPDKTSYVTLGFRFDAGSETSKEISAFRLHLENYSVNTDEFVLEVYCYADNKYYMFYIGLAGSEQ